MNTIKKEFSYKLSWITFIGTIIIVNCHSSLYCFSRNSPYFSDKLVKYISYLNVPVMSYFFFVSGFLFFYNYSNNKILSKWKSRIFTLVIPYVIWNFITYVLFQINQHEMDLSVRGFLGAFILYKDHHPVDGVLWYIFDLCIYVISAPVIYYLLRNKVVGLLTVLSIIGYNLYKVPDYYSFTYWIPVFMFGSYIAIHYLNEFQDLNSKVFKINNTLAILLMSALLFITCSIIVKFTVNSARFTYLFRIFAWAYIFLLSFIVRFKRPDALVKKTSFFIYASQVAVLYFLPVYVRYNGSKVKTKIGSKFNEPDNCKLFCYATRAVKAE